MNFENFNAPETTPEPEKPEAEQENAENDAEVQAEVQKVNEKIEEVGDELLETDFKKIEPTEALKLQGKVEMVLSAVMAVSGAIGAYHTGESFLKGGDIPFAVPLTGAGVLFAVNGFHKFVDGYRKMLGYVEKHEAKKYEKLG